MNFLNLKYFIVTAEEMNFTKGGKTTFISQQSLSNHIAKLEDYFGVQLFDRNTPLTLTDAGESLLKSARKILNVKQEAELELQDIRDFRSAVLYNRRSQYERFCDTASPADEIWPGFSAGADTPCGGYL